MKFLWGSQQITSHRLTTNTPVIYKTTLNGRKCLPWVLHSVNGVLDNTSVVSGSRSTGIPRRRFGGCVALPSEFHDGGSTHTHHLDEGKRYLNVRESVAVYRLYCVMLVSSSTYSLTLSAP
jgi:hypothetical protein